MPRLYSCEQCGKPSPHKRCPAHQLRDRPRGRPYRRVRAAAMARDQHRCQDCGRPVRDDPTLPLADRAAVDHDQRLAEGGSDDLSNLRTLCAPCNRRKG